MKKKSKDVEKKFFSYKKLWRAYKIARGKYRTEPSKENMAIRIKYAKKILGVANGLFKKGLIEKMPIFEELKNG